MMTTKEIMAVTAKADYRRNFWNAMKCVPDTEILVRNALGDDKTMYMPRESEEMFRRLVRENGVIRGLATCFSLYDGSSTIWAYDSDDYAAFVGEGESIPCFDVADDFDPIQVNANKMASLAKVSSEFIHDSGFDVEEYITKRMARRFARTEDRVFVNGTGTGEPTGLLHATNGAETAATVSSIAYDDCIDLFFSVKPEYRRNGVWLMNDSTALALSKLKDDGGNLLWNQSKDTIMGKPVIICNEMPDAEEGEKPVLFGDLSYYWIVDRSLVSLRPLHELFAESGKVGYLGQERLDGRLVRTEAAKVIAIAAE